MDLQAYLDERRSIIDAALDKILPGEETHPPPLCEAMRYSVFAGGKRLRPILCLAGCEAVEKDFQQVIPIACAIEMIHTYSLIHDDLPALDNDDLRRGKATSHKVYGEAMAILAGDALLTEAFGILSSSIIKDGMDTLAGLKAVHEIALASGIRGMIAGQVMDVKKEGQDFNSEELDFIHQNKTARLITASVKSGAMALGAKADKINALQNFGMALGLCFQIVDDILDVVGDKRLGKEIGRDQALGKATYPALYGLEKSRERAKELASQAKQALSEFGPRAEPLLLIADYIHKRET